MREESVTWDEPAAIGSAYLAIRTGDLRLIRERPPGLGLLVTLPLNLLVHPTLPPVGDVDGAMADYVFGLRLLHTAGNDTVAMLRVARSCVLALALLLGLGLYLWSRRLGGEAAGLLSLVLFAFCPNLLAHSRIAANDMTSTACMFLALLALDAWQRRPSSARAAAAGIALGLALDMKVTGVLIVPVYGVLLAIGLRDRERRRVWTSGLGSMALVAFVTLGAGMAGQFDYARFVRCFGFIYTNLNPGYLNYLNGGFSAEPYRYYYVYAALIKTPIPLLILAPLGTYALLRDPRWRITAVIVLLPIVTFAVATSFDPRNFGLRRLLPMVPFLILLAGQAVLLPLARGARIAVLGGLCAWQWVSVAAVAPHHLAYFNELVGGPRWGMYHLDGDNIDWGQELPGLKAWIDAHHDVPVRLWYYGTGRPETYGMHLETPGDGEIAAPRQAVYCVSAHILARFEWAARRQGPQCSWLHRYTPVDRIGWSMYLFDFRDPAVRLPVSPRVR